MLKDLYTTMYRIRVFESKAAECFGKGLVAGNLHLAIGQEACAAGACYALQPTDYIAATHRGHGQAIAKGGDTRNMMAEIFGKKTGYCHGKGGSMHIAEFEHLRSLGANGIIGASFPIAAGSALASKLLGDTHVTLCFFGDGAANEGSFQEALNMSAVWKLPVVFFCENNGYAVSTAVSRVTCTENIADRAKGFNVPGKIIDGNDVFAVYEAIKEAVEYARAGNGPSIVEAKTFRHQGHYCGDPAVYRPASYMEEANKKDAIIRTRQILLENGFTQDDINGIDKAAEKEIEEALKFAVESDFPDPSEATKNVYAMDNDRSVVR
jgi:pyruvate dehydrogenase E1 component alpha subunit